MIAPAYRFFCLSGGIAVGGPTTWHVTDWDQRRVISVSMDGEEEDDGVAIQHLRRHIDNLAPDVRRIHVSPTGDIESIYSDAGNDPTYCVHYPSLSDLELPNGVQTVSRDNLEELERLGPDVDLVSYPASSPSARKLHRAGNACQYNAKEDVGGLQILLHVAIRREVLERAEYVDAAPQAP